MWTNIGQIIIHITYITYAALSEWRGRQNNHRRTLRIPTRFHGFTLGHANNVTLTINAKENTPNMRSHIGNFLLMFWYLQSAIIYNNSFLFDLHLEYFPKLLECNNLFVLKDKRHQNHEEVKLSKFCETLDVGSLHKAS